MNELPKDWTLSTIGEVADVIRGVTYSKEDTLSKNDENAIPLLRATNLEVDSIDFEDMVYVPKRVVKDQQILRLNDIFLAASSGSISVVGKSAQVVKTNGETFGAFCAVIRSKDIHPKFLSYWVQSPVVRDYWSATAKGTNINNLKPSDISGTQIPVPPIEEQLRIVELLENCTNRLNLIMTDLKAIGVKSFQFRKSIMQEAFSNPNYKWKTISLDEVADVIDPHPSHRAPAIDPNGIPFVGIGDVNEDGDADFKKARLVSPSIFQEHSERYSLQKGLLGLGRVASIGKVVKLPRASKPYTISPTLAVIECTNIDFNYLFFALQSPQIQGQLNKLKQGSGRQSVGIIKLRKVVVPIVSIEIQAKIVAEIEQKLLLLQESNRNYAKIIMSTTTLKKAMLRDAFNGKLTRMV